MLKLVVLVVPVDGGVPQLNEELPEELNDDVIEAVGGEGDRCWGGVPKRWARRVVFLGASHGTVPLPCGGPPSVAS